MTPVRRMEIKRNKWKKKAVERATKLRESRKEIHRLKDVIQKIKGSTQTEPGQTPTIIAPTTSPLTLVPDAFANATPSNQVVDSTRSLCVLFVICGIQSFRSIPRDLVVLSWQHWVPHFTSIINWTLRFGLALLKEVKMITEPWIAIMDTSFTMGKVRLLVVLSVPLSALGMRKSALTVEDVHCVWVEAAQGLNGEKVYDSLERLFLITGAPVAILKDSGGDLGKGVRFWKSRTHHPDLEILEDIGHVVANELKHEYANLAIFKSFVKTINRITHRVSLTELSFLTPPKLRTKGRFMGIAKLARWAEKIIELLRNNKNTQAFRILRRLNNLIPGLSRYRMFIRRFKNTCDCVNRFLAILKNEGLTQSTCKKVRAILGTLSPWSRISIRLNKWLDRHIEIHASLKLGDMPLLVSSDIIESLFGKFKAILARSPRAEFNRLILLIPTLCGHPNRTDIVQDLKTVSHGDLLRWIKKNLQTTQWQFRRAFNCGQLLFEGVPKTGKEHGIAA